MTSSCPIRNEHLAAGQAAYDSLASWRGTFEAVDALAKRFPDHDGEACLLKVASLNALMGANVPYVWDMAGHVREIMADSNGEDGPPLVERLARHGDKSHRSFASKYAHFFIDSDRYPIYDVHVRTAMAYHLGDHRVHLDSYTEFTLRFERLLALCESNVSLRAIDRYLWIAGMHKVWQANPNGSLSRDIKAFFESLDSEATQIFDLAP